MASSSVGVATWVLRVMRMEVVGAGYRRLPRPSALRVVLHALAVSWSCHFGQVWLISLSTASSELGPCLRYLTIPVHSLPVPTAAGIRSEASNLPVPSFSAAVSTVDACARIGLT